jgi:hypothetical protein
MNAVTTTKAKDEYRLEHHPEFLRRVAEARADIAAGKGIPFRAPKRPARRKKVGR